MKKQDFINQAVKFALHSAILLLLCFCSIQSMAQGTNASITGRVLGSKGEPVIGATIIVRNESTGFTTGTTTTATGDFNFRQLPLGSPYTVKASFIGYGDQTRTGYVLNQGDNIRVDFELKEQAYEVSTIQVVANSLKKGIDVLGSATSVSSSDLKTLPINGRNFTSLIDLSPLSTGYNIAGQLMSSTNFTIDGMSARSPLSSGYSNRGPYLVSLEAVREFQVVTNMYDVVQGRAGGGTISSVTKSGTNEIHGSAFYFDRADNLASKYDANGKRRNNPYSISQYGGSLGGPIIKNRLHFFLAWDHQTDKRPLQIADISSVDDEKRLDISKDNLDRFVSIARDKYGVADSPQTGSFDKNRYSNSILARIDYQINATNMLTIRNNYNRDMNNNSEGDNSSINLYEVYGSHLSIDNSLLASLRTVVGPRLTNEMKVQYLYNLDDGYTGTQIPSNNIPRAVVEGIKSDVDGKTLTLGSAQLGGQRYMPESFKNNVFQFIDNVYYNTEKVNYTFGVDVMYTHLNSLATSEMNGKFYYIGLDAFERNEPYRYSRQIPDGDPTVKQGTISAAAYAQAQMKPFRGGDLVLGLRTDYTTYISNPEDNKLLTQELGLSTTNKVKTFLPQPRIQLTWDINEKRTDIIRVGGGMFGSSLNNYSMVNNLEFNGLKVYEIDIQNPKTGAPIVPQANFPQYRKDPSTAPGMELFDKLGIQKVSTFNVNGKDVKVPVIYKFNISYNKFLSDRFRVGATLYGTFARNNYMYVDRNMVDQPYFTLSNEGNRGVFVPAASIAPNGTTDWTKDKKSDKIGRVLELNSDGKVNTYTAVIDATHIYFRDGQFTASYTWNDSKDNTSYNGNVANSATLYQMVKDDPRDLSHMSYSDNQFRNKVVFYGSLPTFHGFLVGVRYSGIGGTRYSMRVNKDINGDPVTSNDLAYVFDPNSSSTPAEIATGVNDLLNNPDIDKSIKDYIKSSFGKVAERNGGINGFYGTWDVKVSKSFKTFKRQALELSVDIFNVGNLINKKNGLTHNLGHQNLLNVQSFDQGIQNYTYKINSTAGKIVNGGNPWQIQLGAKYVF